MLDEIWREIAACLADPGQCLHGARPYWGYALAAASLAVAWLVLARARRRDRLSAERQFRELQSLRMRADPLAPGDPETRRRALHRALVAIHIEIDLLIDRLARASDGLRDIVKAPPEKAVERFRGLAPEWLIDTRAAYRAGIAAIALAEAQVPATIGAFYDLIHIWNSRVRAFAGGVHGLNADMLKRLIDTNQRIRAVGESCRILIERYLEDEELPPLPKWVDVRFSDAEHNRIRKRADGLDLSSA